MRVAIDLNDVVRAYTQQFASYYKKAIDRSIDLDNLDVWTIDFKQIFKFESKKDFIKFVYDDYPYEIYGCAQTMNRNTGSRFSDWVKETEDFDFDIDLTIISTGEYGKTIGSTYYFLNKIGTKVRKINLYLKPDSVWDEYDVIITANPDILMLKPENKISIKIDTSYNEEVKGDFTFESFLDFMYDLNILEEINKKLNK